MVTTRPPKTIVKPTALGPVANTDTKFLIYGLFKRAEFWHRTGCRVCNFRPPYVQFTAAANTLEVREHIWGDDELQCHNLPDLVADGEVGKAWPDQ